MAITPFFAPARFTTLPRRPHNLSSLAKAANSKTRAVSNTFRRGATPVQAALSMGKVDHMAEYEEKYHGHNMQYPPV